MEQTFTRASYDRMLQQLEEMKSRRSAVVEDIKEAREQGDLRENFAYHAARDEQGILEAQIAEMEARLDNAKILEEGEVLDEVAVGVPVVVQNLETGQNRPYVICNAEEWLDVENGASAQSPIGSALLGQKVGDTVEVEGPNGVVPFKIVSIGAA